MSSMLASPVDSDVTSAPPHYRRLVVAACPRSGTGYTAALFRAAGIQCGHEQRYMPFPAIAEPALRANEPRMRACARRIRQSLRRAADRTPGESSWMAVPRLPFTGRALRIVQVRHPLQVIESFTGTGLWSDTSRRDASQNRYAGIYYTATGDDVTDTLRWWWLWNKLCLPFADVVWKLEDIDEDALASVLRLMGVDRAGPTARSALAQVPRSVNTQRARTSRRRWLSWSAIKDGVDKERAETLARALGYDL